MRRASRHPRLLVAAVLAALALAAGPAPATYSDAELCSPGFALERLARSDMRALVGATEAAEGGRGLLAQVYERWGVLGHYLKARDAVADSAPGTSAEAIDAAVRESLGRACAGGVPPA